MLALRLARGAHPLVQLRRLMVAAASAGVGFLLLCTLGSALAQPAGSLLRLLWCMVPLAATVHLAVAVARTDPSTRPRPGLSAIGLGPARLTAVAATSTAVSCTLGSMVALLFFLHLRGDLSGLPFDGAAAELLSADQPLPLAAALTLLSLVPLCAATASALALRPRRVTPAEPEEADAVPRQPEGLPWGVALVAAGLAVEAYASRGAAGGLDGSPAGVLGGWALTALGLAMAGPGLTAFCGRLLQSARPGAMRLLAGRALQQEASRIGRPLGVLCAVASGAIALTSLYDAGSGPDSFGPLAGLGVALVMGCTTATLLTATLEARHARADTTDTLRRLGTPAKLLRGAATLRAAALLTIFTPLTWAVAHLAALLLTP
ncbi:hypothetical protein NLX86_00515 [Streptomyces sp. A3M-1-3]|uniref:hypothetical protein n=1 Tax=Streptomyces sp. A3M-1-3 TaxID=2962044 RepID=UPI0020B7DF3C|nr:hypothetical protein [Streptomyces sp. A3M-1-3]MCP3816671.1 hypothetical protein [Streptomyces sp. A3M-1-3]